MNENGLFSLLLCIYIDLVTEMFINVHYPC